MGTSQVLDELSAAKSQQAPIALVPENDEMVLVSETSAWPRPTCTGRTSGSRRFPGGTPDSSPAMFCQNIG